MLEGAGRARFELVAGLVGYKIFFAQVAEYCSYACECDMNEKINATEGLW